MTALTERTVQGLLMHWVLSEHQHILVLPNSVDVFHWESDLISITKSRLAHEFEIKLSMADYRRDAKKRSKHWWLSERQNPRYIPSYFWYVTDFDIEPPTYAGWVKLVYESRQCRWLCHVAKEAPRLHKTKLDEKRLLAMLRPMSFRIARLWERSGDPKWFREPSGNGRETRIDAQIELPQLLPVDGAIGHAL